MTPEEKLIVRRLNEQTKLTATSVNALAVALAAAAVIIPGVNNPAVLLSWQPPALFFGSLGLHLIARTILRFMRSEE